MRFSFYNTHDISKVPVKTIKQDLNEAISKSPINTGPLYQLNNSIQMATSLEDIRNHLNCFFDTNQHPIESQLADGLYCLWLDITICEFYGKNCSYELNAIILMAELADVVVNHLNISNELKYHCYQNMTHIITRHNTRDALWANLVSFNNHLGNSHHHLMVFEAHDKGLTNRLHGHIKSFFLAYEHQSASKPEFLKKNPDNSALIDSYLCRKYGLHPLWLIEKHLRFRSNISMLKGGSTQEHLNLKENGFEVLSRDNSFEQPTNLRPAPLTKSAQSNEYRTSQDLFAIMSWMTQQEQNTPHGGYYAVGTKKGGLESMVDIVLDNLACITFIGNLNSGSYREKSESAFLHGPHFILISKKTCHQHQSAFHQNVWDIPASKILFLFESQEELNIFNQKISRAFQIGLLSEHAQEIVKNNAFCYKSFIAKYDIPEIESMPSLMSRTNTGQTEYSSQASTPRPLLSLSEIGLFGIRNCPQALSQPRTPSTSNIEIPRNLSDVSV